MGTAVSCWCSPWLRLLKRAGSLIIKFGDHRCPLGRIKKTIAPSREHALRNETQKMHLETKSKIRLRSPQRSLRLDQVAKQLEWGKSASVKGS